MKKHDPDRHRRPVFPSDFTVMPCVIERSHENSPVSSSSRESLSGGEESRSPVKLSPRSSNSPKRTSSKLNCSSSTVEATSSSFDSSFTVGLTPKKSKNLAELRTYIDNLEEKNQVLEERNKNLQDEMFNKINFLSDLQQKYDDCIDDIVQLNSKINQLESGCSQDSSGQTTVSMQSSQAKDKKIVALKRDMGDIKEDGKLWRVRCNLLDVDNNLLKNQMAELEQIIIELRNGNGDQSRPPSNRSKSKLSNRGSPKIRNLSVRVAPVAMTDTEQYLPPIQAQTPKRPSLVKTTDAYNISGRAVTNITQSSTKSKEVRSITPSLPPIECVVGRSKHYPRPPSHPNPKPHQSSIRSVTPIFNPLPLPTNNQFHLPHLPFPPSKPKTNKTRKYTR